MQRRLPSNAFCSLELTPLLQSRKQPLQQMARRCAELAKYAGQNNLW